MVYARHADSHYTDTSLHRQLLLVIPIIPTKLSSITPTPIIQTKSLMTVIYPHYIDQKRFHYADSHYTDNMLNDCNLFPLYRPKKVPLCRLPLYQQKV